MSLFIRRTVPLVITFIVGVVIAMDYFYTDPYKILFEGSKLFSGWVTIIIGFAAVLATLTHVLHNSRTTIREVKERKYGRNLLKSSLIVVSSTVVAIVGFGLGTKSSAWDWLVKYLITALEYTLGCTLALFVGLAFYKSWKTKVLESVFISGLCFFAIMSTHPLLMAIFPGVEVFTNFLREEVYTTAMRGFYIATGVGGVILGVRVLAGLERGWLGA